MAVGVGVGHGLVPSDSGGEWCEVWLGFWGGDAPRGGEPPARNGGDGIRQEAPRSSTLGQDWLH